MATRNKFADIALHWAGSMLERFVAKGKGPALFREQVPVMGRFLVTMGTFCKCARLTAAAPALCGAVLELLLVRTLTLRLLIDVPIWPCCSLQMPSGWRLALAVSQTATA